MTAFMLIVSGVLLILAVPIGVSLGAASWLTIVVGGTFKTIIVAQKIMDGVNKFSLLAIPMFTLAGEIMTLGGVSDKLVFLANKIVGRFKGGLSMVTTLACMFFGAISGSATATAAAIGGMLCDPMEKSGYPRDYTAAVIGSSGLLGLIIPPSGTMLMYSIIADTSVIRMFTSGIIPGIIMGVSLMAVEWYRAKKHGYGEGNVEISDYQGISKTRLIVYSFLALMSPAIILGGIYSGKFTVTEAAGVSVLYGALVGYLIYKKLTLRNILDACRNTGIGSAMILFLIGAASIFGWMLTVQQIPNKLVTLISGVTTSPAVVLLLCNIILLVAGALLDNVAAITLLTPVMVPLVKAYGIDPHFFGLIMIVNLSIGQITPPIGMNLFVASNICGVKVDKTIKQNWPFIITLVIDLFLFTYVPALVNFLPNMILK
jgi:C4-dicarboxylate transporter DctM subunit